MSQCVTAMVEYDHKVYKGTGYNKVFFFCYLGCEDNEIQSPCTPQSARRICAKVK